MKLQKYLIFSLGMFFLSIISASAQCAMCRASLENSMSNGENLVRGINYGIIYLASAPYLVILVVVYFWYKSSKKNYETHIKNTSHSTGKMPTL